MAKKRLDQLVFERGLTESRERAKTTIMAGQVFVNGQRSDKPGTPVPEDAKIEIHGETMPFVSRGGYKLDKALKVFPVDPAGSHCIDCGASTGGFTDVLLQHGASLVYAVDVGYGQLAWKLREDMDVSFISIKLILPALKGILKPDADIICLIKPQFEAGKDKVGKKGVVRDIGVHREVVRDILDFCREHQLSCHGLDYSPIRGPEGNIEFLLWLKNSDNNALEPDVDAVVDAAHKHIS